MFSSKKSSADEASEIDPEEVEEIVDDIADMIFLADGGLETDWNEYPIEIYRLFCEWRKAEKDVAKGDHEITWAFMKGFSNETNGTAGNRRR
jgi:hypothetical protein